MLEKQRSAVGKLNIRYSYLILALALLSFFATLPLPHIGEEGVYTISSYEMWYQQHFLYPILYGINYGRPPLYNWLIIPLANLIGWSNMIMAARLITLLATIGTGFILAFLSKRLFKESGFALFALLVYLTGDALMYHGWLAYSDPLFGFFILTAIAFLWLANIEERYSFVWLAALSITAAFLTKALTAYVFYFLAFALFVKQAGKRAFILKPANLLTQCLIIGFPLLWGALTSGSNGAGMVYDVLQKFSFPELGTYFKQIVFFPLEILIRFLPATGLLAYFFFTKRITEPEKEPRTMATLGWLIVLSFIPYWFVPETSSRYVLPLYPFIALWIAKALWRLKQVNINHCLKWFLAAVIIKYVFALGLFPYYQAQYRADSLSIAKQILAKTKDKPLYINVPTAKGLNITAAIDVLRFPAPPLTFPSLAKEADYFVINGEPDPSVGDLYATFVLDKQQNKIYLLCKGKACDF